MKVHIWGRDTVPTFALLAHTPTALSYTASKSVGNSTPSHRKLQFDAIYASAFESIKYPNLSK